MMMPHAKQFICSFVHHNHHHHRDHAQQPIWKTAQLVARSINPSRLLIRPAQTEAQSERRNNKYKHKPIQIQTLLNTNTK